MEEVNYTDRGRQLDGGPSRTKVTGRKLLGRCLASRQTVTVVAATLAKVLSAIGRADTLFKTFLFIHAVIIDFIAGLKGRVRGATVGKNKDRLLPVTEILLAMSKATGKHETIRKRRV